MGRLNTGGGKKFLKKLMNNLIDKCEDDDDKQENDFNIYNTFK
jgi:CRISPR/Cas system CSM-associated protein Csm2 small subunit